MAVALVGIINEIVTYEVKRIAVASERAKLVTIVPSADHRHKETLRSVSLIFNQSNIDPPDCLYKYSINGIIS